MPGSKKASAAAPRFVTCSFRCRSARAARTLTIGRASSRPASGPLSTAAADRIAAHYAQPARRSYWVGCSSGGRQGLKEAQRFPEDFDGIAASAPAYNWIPLTAYGAKVQQVLTNPAGGLAPPQLALLKEAAIAACDARDGVTDRTIADPRRCAFDPGALECAAETTSGCLTRAQVEAARSIYAGVVNPRTGARLLPGPAPGGELEWGAYTPGAFPIAANYWRDLVIHDETWTPAKLDL